MVSLGSTTDPSSLLLAIYEDFRILTGLDAESFVNEGLSDI